MRRLLGVWMTASALLGCGGSQVEEQPRLQLDDDGEVFVAGIVSRLARKRYDLVELMIAEDAKETLSNARLAASWKQLVDHVGAPEKNPRLLKVGTVPITRDDGAIGFFGQASFECAKGVGRLRVEISCASSGPVGGECRPPYLVEELLLEAERGAPKGPKKPPRLE